MDKGFEGGKNIALKVPLHLYDATVRFYAEVLGLARVGAPVAGAVGFRFGPSTLWIDRCPGLSQPELWLELVTEDTAAAAAALAAEGVVRCDEIEPLGPGFDGFWISAPGGIIHLVDAKAGAWA